VIDQIMLARIDPVLGGFGIDWGVIAILGSALIYIFSRWDDRQLVRLEELAARHAATERYATQLEAARAVAITSTSHSRSSIAKPSRSAGV